MPVADAKQSRDRLKEYRDQLQSLRADRTKLREERDAAREAFTGTEFEAGTDLTSTDEFHAAENAVKTLGECEDQIHQLEQAEALLLRSIGGPSSDGNGHGLVRPTSQEVVRYGSGYQSARSLIANSETYRHARESGVFGSKMHYGTIVLGELCDADHFASWAKMAQAPRAQGPWPPDALGPATPGEVTTPIVEHLIEDDSRGLQPHILRPLTLLDLIPTGTTSSNMIQYVMLKALPQGAAVVEEGELKPELGIEFEDATSPVRTIAGWIKLLRPAMDDAPFVVTLIRELLPYEIRRVLEGQVLTGDGTGQNFLGLMNVPGLGSVTADPSDTVADAILRAMTVVMLTDQTPNFVAINPIDWQELALSKSSGSGTYMFDFASALGGMPAPSIWGLRVVSTRMVEPKHPIVGDTSAMMLLIREGVTVRTSDSDQDDFVHNRVTILAEMRAAFIVWRPTAFCVADLT